MSACTGANVRAVLLNVNTPQTRGTAFSVFALADDLGKGLGPFFASGLILALGRTAVWSIYQYGYCMSRHCACAVLSKDARRRDRGVYTVPEMTGLSHNFIS